MKNNWSVVAGSYSAADVPGWQAVAVMAPRWKNLFMQVF